MIKMKDIAINELKKQLKEGTFYWKTKLNMTGNKYE